MASLNFTKRTMAVVVAIGLAGAATLGLVAYVGGIEARALRSTEAIDTFVAKEIIPIGTAGDSAISNGLIVRRPVPRLALTDGVIQSLVEIKDKVAGANILKGEQIVGARFVNATEVRGLRPIPADRQALSVEVATPPGVAGFITPGDRVSIIAQIETTGESRVQYLLQDVEVLAVGNRTANTETKQQPSGGLGAAAAQQQQRVLLTLALTPAESEKLVYAVLKGQVYFTLLPQDQKPVGTSGRTSQNVFD